MDMFNKFWNQISKYLPLSPFTQFIDQFSNLPALGYLNWFFPVKECITVMEAYLVAVGIYYLYQMIMRWIKVIQ